MDLFYSIGFALLLFSSGGFARLDASLAKKADAIEEVPFSVLSFSPQTAGSEGASEDATSDKGLSSGASTKPDTLDDQNTGLDSDLSEYQNAFANRVSLDSFESAISPSRLKIFFQTTMKKGFEQIKIRAISDLSIRKERSFLKTANLSGITVVDTYKCIEVANLSSLMLSGFNPSEGGLVWLRTDKEIKADLFASICRTIGVYFPNKSVILSNIDLFPKSGEGVPFSNKLLLAEVSNDKANNISSVFMPHLDDEYDEYDEDYKSTSVQMVVPAALCFSMVDEDFETQGKIVPRLSFDYGISRIIKEYHPFISEVVQGVKSLYPKAIIVLKNEEIEKEEKMRTDKIEGIAKSQKLKYEGYCKAMEANSLISNAVEKILSSDVSNTKIEEI